MREQLNPGTYSSVRAVRWQDDTTKDGAAILRVTFDVAGFEVEWTCWAEDMLKDGKPSSNMRGLLALGVTEEDIADWGSGEALRGLDRNEVNVVVEHNKNGYAVIKWVNDPREMRQAKPLDRGARATVAQKMRAALAAERLRGDALKPPARQDAPNDDIFGSSNDPFDPNSPGFGR